MPIRAEEQAFLNAVADISLGIAEWAERCLRDGISLELVKGRLRLLGDIARPDSAPAPKG